jgi:hypothetical protein
VKRSSSLTFTRMAPQLHVASIFWRDRVWWSGDFFEGEIGEVMRMNILIRSPERVFVTRNRNTDTWIRDV